MADSANPTPRWRHEPRRWQPASPELAEVRLPANHHDIPPHIDNGILVLPNFYVATADATTAFYRFRQARPRVERLPDNDAGSASGLYLRAGPRRGGIVPCTSPRALALDATQPHDVVGAVGHGDRAAYCLQSREVGCEQLLGVAKRA